MACSVFSFHFFGLRSRSNPAELLLFWLHALPLVHFLSCSTLGILLWHFRKIFVAAAFIFFFFFSFWLHPDDCRCAVEYTGLCAVGQLVALHGRCVTQTCLFPPPFLLLLFFSINYSFVLIYSSVVTYFLAPLPNMICSRCAVDDPLAPTEGSATTFLYLVLSLLSSLLFWFCIFAFFSLLLLLLQELERYWILPDRLPHPLRLRRAGRTRPYRSGTSPFARLLLHQKCSFRLCKCSLTRHRSPSQQ